MEALRSLHDSNTRLGQQIDLLRAAISRIKSVLDRPSILGDCDK